VANGAAQTFATSMASAAFVPSSHAQTAGERAEAFHVDQALIVIGAVLESLAACQSAPTDPGSVLIRPDPMHFPVRQ
jgi:hypothetical protein